MVKRSFNGVFENLRKASAMQTNRVLSDRELLECFVETRDESAFMVLIERHGPMVLGVCRRVLPNVHDVEDACQATFIVLARKAATVRKKTSLGSWLHGVAYRVAVTLKRDQARRKVRERGAEPPTPRDPAAEVTWREVQTILDEELQRLPERHRAPLVLCYLECMTRDEAAAQLGLSSGALHGRLERARDLLRDRLTKRGLTLSAALSAAALGESVAQSAIPPLFIVSSTKAAMLIAAGQPLSDNLVAANVLVLAKGVLMSMFLTKLKLGAVAVLCAALVISMVGGFATSHVVAQDPAPKPVAQQPATPKKVESDADFIRRISKDLRENDPTPAEVHFFVASKDAGKRQKLVDLFIQERDARKGLIADEPNVTPELQKIRAAAARMQSTNNLKQIGLAMHNYAQANGTLPPAAICDKNGKPLLSWRVALLPYIDQNRLYQQFKLDEPWDSEHNKALAETLVKVYIHPQQPKDKWNFSYYRLFYGKEAMFELKEGRKLADITDGTSNTIMVVEAAEGVLWTKPDDFKYDAKKPLPRFGTFSDKGFSALMGDGAVLFVSKTASEKKLRAAITANAGDRVEEEKDPPVAPAPEADPGS
jgi:RNA polymerase sigma factor (sigma-70 family)